MTHFRRLAAPILSMVAALAAAPARAEAVEHAEVRLERMTSPEVERRIADGATTILVPTGGTEDNGAHMVLGKHNLIVAETTRRIALELGDALVAPVLAYVPEGPLDDRAGHMGHAGTITVPNSVFEGVLEAAARSFKAHGFTTIVFVGDSGLNQAPQEALAARLNDEWEGEGIIVISAASYYGDNGGARHLVGEGMSAADAEAHAGPRDTSELMAVDPDATRRDPETGKLLGGAGPHQQATGALGERLLRGKVAAAVAEVKERRMARATEGTPRQGLLAWFWRLLAG